MKENLNIPIRKNFSLNFSFTNNKTADERRREVDELKVIVEKMVFFIDNLDL